MKHKAMRTTDRKNWRTPRSLFDRLNEEFGFTLDPCSDHENHLCDRYYTIEDDGLVQDWSCDRVFMNPPYGIDLKDWMKKAYQESLKGAVVVCLVPSRTDVGWWHDYALKGEIRYIRGRLKFDDTLRGNAPFPSVLVIFDRKEIPIDIQQQGELAL